MKGKQKAPSVKTKEMSKGKPQEGLWDEGSPCDFQQEEGYGHPIRGNEAQKQFGKGRSDLPVYVVIKKSGEIKPRRGYPEVLEDQFFSSLVCSPDGRWFFSGVLNGWPGLTLLELESLEELKLDDNIQTFWKQGESRQMRRSFSFTDFFKKSPKSKPEFPQGFESIRATMYLPEYASRGYSKSSPGYLWYFSEVGDSLDDFKFAHGTNLISATEEHDFAKHGKLAKATKAYHFGHRYAKEVESEEDLQTYHSGVFVEWEHGEYGSVIELAWRHGIGGYKGLSNWIDNRDEKPFTTLYQKMPASHKLPYVMNRSEIRLYDIPPKSIEEFKGFLEKHTGPTKRFLDAGVSESGVIKLKDRTKPDICRFILNRILKNPNYSTPNYKTKEMGINCQTFSATFFAFLTHGEKANGFSKMGNVEFNPIENRIQWFSESFVDHKQIPVEYEEIKEQ